MIGDINQLQLKDTLIESIGQEAIFERYVGVPVIMNHRAFHGPDFIREDRNKPSFSYFYLPDGKLILKDFGKGNRYFAMDIVMEYYNCNFIDALNYLENDFRSYTPSAKAIERYELAKKESVYKFKPMSSVIRKYNSNDIKYWLSVGWTKNQIKKYKVFPVQSRHSEKHDGVHCTYDYNTNHKDPCYAYNLGKGHIKFYFPSRKNDAKYPKFITNSRNWQGYNELPEKGDLLVITKSLKDVGVWDRLGITATSPPAEGFSQDDFIDSIVKDLISRFKTIVMNFDPDPAGILGAEKYKEAYGFDNFSLGDAYGGKDISEVYENSSLEGVNKAKSDLLESIKQTTEPPF